jgi:hypothetical protein
MWTLIDYAKADQKEKLKAASLIVECSDKRFNLLKIDPQLHELQQYTESIINKERELSLKEKVLLEAHREGKKLSWTKLALTLDEDRVF